MIKFNREAGFPRPFRLLKPKEYRLVFAKAERLAGRYFTVLYRNNESGRPRLGMAVSKKNLPRAVDRNRVKRALREKFRHQKNDLMSVDIVFITRPSVSQLDSSGLQHEIGRLLSRLPPISRAVMTEPLF